MSDQITNMLVDLAGFQRLPANINVEEYSLDESEILANMDSKIYEYVKSVDNFSKLVHDKNKIKPIYENIVKIIDEFDTELNDSYKHLWE